MKRAPLVLLLVAALLLTTGFRIVQGGETTLASGETYEGMMLFMGGNYTVEDGATIDGDVWMVGGNMMLHGKITGDAHLYGGNISIIGDGSIDGDFIDQRSEGSGGDGFNVVDIGPVAALVCCGLPLLLIALVIVLLMRLRKRRATSAQPAETPMSPGTT